MNNNQLTITQTPQARARLTSYPKHVQLKLVQLRNWILEVAIEESIPEIEETLKWGELGYLAKKGSTVRLNWTENRPDQYGMYFSCSSRLVETFRQVFGSVFQYEKNRALIFQLDEEPPEQEVKACIRAALLYHRVKADPMLRMV